MKEIGFQGQKCIVTQYWCMVYNIYVYLSLVGIIGGSVDTVVGYYIPEHTDSVTSIAAFVAKGTYTHIYLHHAHKITKQYLHIIYLTFMHIYMQTKWKNMLMFVA